MSLKNLDELWLVTESGLYGILETKKKIFDTPAAELRAMSDRAVQEMHDSEDEFHHGYMLQRFGPIAVLTISGTLVNDDNPYNRYWGEVGYPQIRAAAMEAVEHPEVKALLLNMDTPGGQVSGISETVDFLKEVNRNHLPIYSHASSSMASGGYWLGSVGRSITTSELATVGSIGVVSIHASYARMFKQDGIDINVLRQGEFKALGNPYETLSDKAREKIEGEMAVIYDTFLEQVSDSRGIGVGKLIETAAEGRVFYGKQAVEVGLADRVDSFDNVVRKLIAKYDSQSGESEEPIYSGTGANTMSKGTKRVLSEAGQAAIEAGVPKEQVLADEAMTSVSEESEEQTTEASTEETTQEETTTEETQASEDQTTQATEEETTPSAEQHEDEEEEEDDEKEAKATSGLVAQVTELSKTLAKAEIRASQAEEKVSAMEANHEALVKIVATAANKMQVAMGSQAISFEGLDAAVVLEQYHKINSQFCQRFKVGSTAEVPGENDTKSIAGGKGSTSTVEQSQQKLTSFSRKK